MKALKENFKGILICLFELVIGILLLMALMVFVMFNDVMKLIH